MTIASFGDKATEDLFHGRGGARVRKIPPDLVRIARRKLDMLNAAASLQDLRVPPGNCLEMLRGDLQGYHSIRVNQQWRIVFRWEEGSAYDVRFMDYHR